MQGTANQDKNTYKSQLFQPTLSMKYNLGESSRPQTWQVDEYEHIALKEMHKQQKNIGYLPGRDTPLLTMMYFNPFCSI